MIRWTMSNFKAFIVCTNVLISCQDYCSMSVQLFLLPKNGMESMKKLSTFLGTSTDPKFLQAVYDTCSIEEVKKRLKSPIDVIFYRKGNLQNFKTIVNFC